MTVLAKKILSWCLKAGILVLAAWFIYHKLLTKNNDLHKFQVLVAGLNKQTVYITIAAVSILMVVNWSLEALKWQYVTRKLIYITRWQAIESVFCGLTWAIITPNRVGEYGGRVFYLPNRKRIHGLFAMIVSSLGQNLVTNILGLIGVLWFVYTYLNLNSLFYAGLAVLIGLFLLLITIFYFNIQWMVGLLTKVKFIQKYSRFFEIMARYTKTELLTIVYYSVLRFVVFTMQYYLLIHLLLPGIPLFTIVMMVFTFLIIQSALPSLDVFDIGVRSLTATRLFSYITDQQIAVVACVSIIWLINLIIPAVIGCFFVLKLKFLTALSAISLLLTGFYLCVLIYLIKGWASLRKPSAIKSGFSTRITVLIAARNEEAGIHLTINDLLAQDYPKELTEIIIVDDHSTDNTAAIIRSYADRGIKLHQMRAGEALNSYKKKAIAEAIAMSKGELMVATDADCRMGPKWLSAIVNYYETEQPVMISSPVTYFQEKSLFELLQTLEFSYLIGIGAAFIGNGKASTCNGANFAYRKDVFNEVGGFTGIDDLASGDDELLLQKVAEVYPNRIGFLKQREAIVYTHAKPTLEEFLQQRRRWASKSTRYKDKKVTAMAVFIWLFNLSLLANALLGFYNLYFLKLFLVQFALKYLFETVFLLPITSFWKRPGLTALLILLSPIHILYFVYVGFMGNTRKYAWKGRLVR